MYMIVFLYPIFYNLFIKYKEYYHSQWNYKGETSMIDFKNGSFLKLKKTNGKENAALINPLLVDEEWIVSEYQTIRDFVVFTNKRIIAVNVQGLTGKKKDFTSIPYSKIQVFSIETAGMLDLDSELDITISGLGTIRFEFTGASDIVQIGKLIASFTL